MEDTSTVKQVSRIEYVGPYQIQTTSALSINFSARIDNYGPKQSLEMFVPDDMDDCAIEPPK